jgi:hypothetical protein
VTVYNTTGRESFGSTQNSTSIYPAASPLPRVGNAVADFVAPKDGRYTIAIRSGGGAYSVDVQAYRPGTELLPRGTVQTIFLDFDGAAVDPAIFGGPAGVVQLSPFSSFVPRWGLTAADENALINSVVASVKENIERDLSARGGNPRFAVRILNSRDDADPFGQPNVTRLVVGGTIAESGISTVGIAQSIDPGNFGNEETALVLLDKVSDPAGPAVSLNTYVTPATADKAKFIGRAVGNIVSHEAGHMAGSWHLDQFNPQGSIMDQGGNAKVLFEVGPDNVGGTADDTDVDFTEDVLNPAEGFTGIEDTRARTAWAFTRGAA